MTQKHIQIGHIHLTLTEILIIKAGLSVALTAVFFVPAPWNVPVGIAANLVWIWRC